VRDALAGAAAVDAALGPVGAESGFVAAYHQRLEQQSRAMQGLDQALTSCGDNANAAAHAYEQHDAANRHTITAQQAGV